MSYGWRRLDDTAVELCDECGFDARSCGDEATGLDTVWQQLVALLDHADVDRAPAPETWSAREYVDHCVEVTRELLGLLARAGSSLSVPAITDPATAAAVTGPALRELPTDDRGLVLAGVYPFPVTVEWIMRHLLHDLGHHVLDIRRGYAALALADGDEIYTITR